MESSNDLQVRNSESAQEKFRELIESFRVKCEQWKDEVTSMRSVIAETATDPALDSFGIPYLYWYCADIFSPQEIARFVGMKDRELIQFVGTLDVDVQCTDCGTVYIETVKSRTALTEVRRGKHRTLRCAKCEREEQDRREAAFRGSRQIRHLRDERLQQLKTMPYKEYLQTPEWQDTRKRALRNAHYACQLCNANARLNVHHRTYVRRGDEYLADLIALCEECHAKFHNKLPAVQP